MTRAPKETDAIDPEESLSSARFRLLIGLCWLGVTLGAVWIVATQRLPWAWDAHVYEDAMHSLRLGHDPYGDGIAVQRAFHGTPASRDPSVTPPYTYVYSPLTLPLLRLLDRVPLNALAALYGLLYVAAFAGIAYACLFAAEPRERRTFTLLGALSPFFPGLLLTDVALSGNVVYLLYAAVLCCAVLGWRRGIWGPFYVAVLVASCFKAPLLTLVLLPVLSARRQIVAATVTAGAGLLLFAAQPLVWPSLFRNYLVAVDLQFALNRDFGFGPSGLLGHVLYRLHMPYTAPCLWFYLLYASGVLLSLGWLAQRYRREQFPLTGWVPVMLIGVVLLNPRIKEYDVGPLCLPMAMVLWRLLGRLRGGGRPFNQTALWFGAVFLAINLLAWQWPQLWEPGECLLLVVLYALGCWNLLRPPCTPSVPHAAIPFPAQNHATNVPG